MNHQRKALEAEYQAAIAKLRSVPDNQWEAAHSDVERLRELVIAAERIAPTPNELHRAKRKYYLRSIGLDA